MIKYLSVFILLIFTGCATYQESQQGDLLEETIFAYEVAVRWGDFIKANTFRDDDSGIEPDFEGFKIFKVSSYEPVNKIVSGDMLTVKQMVEIQYYNINTLIEKTIIDRQLWEYNKDNKKWRLKSALPQFK